MTAIRLLRLGLLLTLICPVGAAWAATYEVGPGMPYNAIGDVAWESLEAGDSVAIHWR